LPLGGLRRRRRSSLHRGRRARRTPPRAGSVLAAVSAVAPRRQSLLELRTGQAARQARARRLPWFPPTQRARVVHANFGGTILEVPAAAPGRLPLRTSARLERRAGPTDATPSRCQAQGVAPTTRPGRDASSRWSARGSRREPPAETRRMSGRRHSTRRMSLYRPCSRPPHSDVSSAEARRRATPPPSESGG